MTAARPGFRATWPAAGERPGDATRLVDEIAAARQPLLAAVTEDGITHRLWAITDPAEQAAVAADLAPRQALIADGHHRYAAYLELQARRHAAGDQAGPWDHGLALLVRLGGVPAADRRDAPGHPRAPAAEAVALAKAAVTVRAMPGDLPAALRELAEAGQDGPAFLIAGGGELHLADHPDPVQAAAAMPAGRSASWRALPASVLAELLIGRLWRVPGGEDVVRVVHQDAAAALRDAEEAGGTAGSAIRSRPTRSVTSPPAASGCRPS